MSNDHLIARLDDKLRAKRESFGKIPVVDVAPLLDGTKKKAVAKEMSWALSNTGFMYVKNHGVSPDLVDAVFSQAHRFFDQPIEQKMKLHVGKSGVALRGYIEPFGENTDPGKTKDLKECFDIGPERRAIEGPFLGQISGPLSSTDFGRSCTRTMKKWSPCQGCCCGGSPSVLTCPKIILRSRC